MNSEQLDKFEVFADLDEQNKIIAARQVQSEAVDKGTVLFDVGEQDGIEYFLYEGEIELTAQDGRKKIISAADPASHFPLALLRPRKYRATVVSERAKLLALDIEVLQDLRKSVPVAGDAFSAFSPLAEGITAVIDDEKEADSVRNFVESAASAIVENRLLIANFDDVSTTIFNVLQDPDLSLDMLISAVQLDAAITAKLIKAANSAFFGGLPRVDSARAAIVRLGQDLSVQLVTVMVCKEVFQSSKEELQLAMHRLWQSSLKLATYSVVIGRRAQPRFAQGPALLGGLMNDIGTLVIIAYLDQFPGMMLNISEHVLASSRIKKKLGSVLLNHWHFPEPIVDAVEYADLYDRPKEEADLSDVICLARMLIRMTSYRKLPVAEVRDLPAYERLGFDLDDPAMLSAIQEEAAKYIQLFQGAFE